MISLTTVEPGRSINIPIQHILHKCHHHATILRLWIFCECHLHTWSAPRRSVYVFAQLSVQFPVKIIWSNIHFAPGVSVQQTLSSWWYLFLVFNACQHVTDGGSHFQSPFTTDLWSQILQNSTARHGSLGLQNFLVFMSHPLKSAGAWLTRISKNNTCWREFLWVTRSTVGMDCFLVIMTKLQSCRESSFICCCRIGGKGYHSYAFDWANFWLAMGK